MKAGFSQKRYWRIRGYDGLTLIFEKTVSLGQFSENQMKLLLQALTAKASLNFDEIIGAYAKRGTTLANNHLSIQREFAYPTMHCGYDLHFEATVVDQSGKIRCHLAATIPHIE